MYIGVIVVEVLVQMLISLNVQQYIPWVIDITAIEDVLLLWMTNTFCWNNAQYRATTEVFTYFVQFDFINLYKGIYQQLITCVRINVYANNITPSCVHTLHMM